MKKNLIGLYKINYRENLLTLKIVQVDWYLNCVSRIFAQLTQLADNRYSFRGRKKKLSSRTIYMFKAAANFLLKIKAKKY